MKLRYSICFLVVVILVGILGASAQSNSGTPLHPENARAWPTKDGWLTLRDFKFGGGETPPELKLHYLTLGAPHRNAAAVFLNWYASEPGQLVFSTVWHTPSSRRDADAPTIPDFVKPKPGVEYIAEYREEWYTKYESEYPRKILDALGGQ